MKICFPVQKDEGMKSVVYDHFGSAPLLAVVDTNAHSVTIVESPVQSRTQEAWSPLMALGSQKIDAIIVAGIGSGAISGLNKKGIRVYRSQAATIQENMTMFKDRSLPELTSEQCCGGHNQEGGCGH